MLIPGHLENTDSEGAALSVEVEVSTGLLLAEDESVAVVVLSLTSTGAVEKTEVWS